MKKHLILLALLLSLAVAGFSQEIVTLSNGKKILINPNKTWEYVNTKGKVLQFGMIGLDYKQSSCFIEKYKIIPILDKRANTDAPYEYDSFIEIVYNIKNATIEDFSNVNLDFELKYESDILVEDPNGFIISYFYKNTFPNGSKLPTINVNAGEEGKITLRYLYNSSFDMNKLLIRFRKPGSTHAFPELRSDWIQFSQLLH